MFREKVHQSWQRHPSFRGLPGRAQSALLAGQTHMAFKLCSPRAWGNGLQEVQGIWGLAGLAWLARDPVEVIALATMKPSPCSAVLEYNATNLDRI